MNSLGERKGNNLLGEGGGNSFYESATKVFFFNDNTLWDMRFGKSNDI